MRKDTYRHKGLRRKLIADLATKGITDRSVLDAMMRIPRHWFLDKAFEEKAYLDLAFPIDREQTISQPYTVAFQTQLLELKSADRVLEIGTGSGFQACVLAQMGVKVYTIERHELLAMKSERMFEMLGYRSIRSFYGDGYLGLPKHAPFDKIIITAAPSKIPERLIEQLAIGGYLVTPEGGQSSAQKMIRLIKVDERRVRKEYHGDFRFVPLLSGME